MSRTAATPSRMEILLLTALARAPMHGYELKLELQYKHVEWWAKCEHGHLYAALARLEKGKFIREVRRPGGRATQRVFAITAAGKKRVAAAVEALGVSEDETFFDVDMFLAACHLLEQDRALEILVGRRDALANRLGDARPMVEQMRPHVPAVGQLIMDHRLRHFAGEIEFLDYCIKVLQAERSWGAYLGDAKLEDFVQRTKVPLERG